MALDEPSVDLLGDSLLDDIGAFYTLRHRAKQDTARRQVEQFLACHPALGAVLLDARGPLRRAFPSAQYSLEVRRDPDIDDEQLVLSIAVSRDPANPAEGVRRLRQLEDERRLDADDRVQGKLTVILESQ